jgi:hypothetical protein
MTADDLIDIVIAPGAEVTEELAQKAAALLGRDLYHTRALLASRIPRIAVQKVDLRAIEDMRRQMEGLGLVSFSCRDEELQKPLHLFKAKTLTFTDTALLGEDENAHVSRLESNSVFLIIKGIRRNFKEKQVVTKTRKLSLLSTLLSGGIPIRRTVEERTTETTAQDERFVRIFEKNSADGCLEIRQYGFNYSCLGAAMAPSSLANINRLAGKIKEFFPEAAYDENLGELSRTKLPPASPRENIDVECKLIYRYRAMKSHRAD